VRLIDTFLVAMPESPGTLLPSLLQHSSHSVESLIQIFKRRTKRETNKVMTRGFEQIPTMGRVDIEEDTRDDDGLLFEEFFEEGQTIVQRSRKLLKVKPDIELA